MIFDGLLERFIPTKNQTHHNLFLMAQQIYKSVVRPTNLQGPQSS